MSGRSDSPTFFHGQPWSSWIERLGRDKPLSDDEPESEPSSSVTRLAVEDIDLYGFCPERDTFYGVVCEICNAIIKPQALIQHMESRHPSGTGPLQPPSTPVQKPAVKTPYCKLSKLKKSQSTPQLQVGANKVSNHASKKPSETSNLHPSLSFSLPQSPELLQVQQSFNNGSNGAGVSSSSPVKSPGQPKRERFKAERSLLKDREYDPDRHCGVMIEETSKPCTRSLTCKAHTVSLRRTVAGRSKSFDKLLADHRASKELPVRQTKLNPSADSQVAASSTVTADTETPKSPPVLSLPDTYPLPQAVDLLFRSLAPHSSSKPTKLEEEFVAELDTSLSNPVQATTSATVAPISTVLPSLSPLANTEESPVIIAAQPPATETLAQNQALFASLSKSYSEFKPAKFEQDHVANGKRIINCTNSKSSIAFSGSGLRNKCEYPESYIQLEATATAAHFSDISWSNYHPEPLAVSRWLRLTSSRKQYHFNIH